MSNVTTPGAGSIDAAIMDAVAAFNAGDVPRAEQLFRTAFAMAPNDLRAIHGMGVVMNQLGRKAEAIAFLAPYVEKGALVETTLLLAQLYDETGDLPRAMICLKTILKSLPTNYNAAMRMAGIKERLGDKPGARECYRLALEGSPNDISAAVKYTNANWAKDPEGGVAIMERLLATMGDKPARRAQILETLILQKEWWERMRRGLMPYHATDISELFYNYASDYVKDYERTAIQRMNGPDHATGRMCLGYARFIQGDRLGAEPLMLPGPGEPPRGNILDCIRFQPAFYDELRREQLSDITAGIPDMFLLTPLAPDPGGVVYLSCNYTYFTAFAQPMIVSLKDKAPGTPVHIHIMDATNDQAYAARAFCEKLAPLKFAISVEAPGFQPNDPNARGYYHAVRFIRFYQHLLAYECPLWMMDVDALFNRDPAEMFAELKGKDIAMRVRPGRFEPWNQFNACIVGASTSPASLEYFRLMAAYIGRFYRDKMLKWGIDQLVMYGVYADMADRGQAPALALLGEKEIDYDYRDDGFVWCNSGAAKFRHLARIANPASLPTADFEGNRFVEVFEHYWKKTQAILQD
ncbi:MAG: hypothetical protein K1X51_09530 [Rhodospirillaceae bacterium]|nr:hypothetical protein [Rhodospirillaceae bacterium]